MKKSKEEIIESILANKIIAIMRNVETKKVLKTVQALYDGGIRLIEVTFNQNSVTGIDDAASSIRMITENFGDGICVGAGTVVNSGQLSAADGAGARYIISPHTSPEIIQETIGLGLVSIPGATTPTEILRAAENGADFVKVFPVKNLGVDYMKAISAPINHIPLLAVGGVNDENLTEFLNAGAVGVGIGSDLVNMKLIQENRFDEITILAKKYTDQI